MLRTSRAGALLVLLALFASSVWLASCAGHVISQRPLANELPVELPKEIQEKFEIHDAVTPTPSPAPVAVEAKHKAKRRGKKKKEVVAAPFVIPMRRPGKDPIWVAEKQVFEITYLGLPAGTFTLEVLPYKVIENRKVYHLRATAVSSDVLNMFYRFNDALESFMDYDGTFSHRFHMNLEETKQDRDCLELYDSEKKQAYYWNRWNKKDSGYTESKEFIPIVAFPQDLLSSTYYLRTVPLAADSVVTFPLVNEGHPFEAIVTVVRREVMPTPLGRVETVVLKPEAKKDGQLQKSGEIYVWLTDDDRRIPVRMEAKVRVGSIVLTLKEVEMGLAPSS